VQALAGELVQRHALMVQMHDAQLTVIVRMQGGIQHVGHEHGVVDRGHADAALKQHQVIALEVVADLQHAFIFEQRTQALQHFGFGELGNAAFVIRQIEAIRCAVATRHITCFARRHRQRDAAQGGAHRIGGRAFELDCHPAGFIRARHPVVQPFERDDGFVLA
jgi:hypothetical protein